jgi:hypothetical protein
MTDTLKERAADAVEQVWRDECGGEWMATEHSQKLVRAVLQAYRKPSEAMLRAASYYGDFSEPGETRLDMWQAMIEAELEERR